MLCCDDDEMIIHFYIYFFSFYMWIWVYSRILLNCIGLSWISNIHFTIYMRQNKENIFMLKTMRIKNIYIHSLYIQYTIYNTYIYFLLNDDIARREFFSIQYIWMGLQNKLKSMILVAKKKLFLVFTLQNKVNRMENIMALMVF